MEFQVSIRAVSGQFQGISRAVLGHFQGSSRAVPGLFVLQTIGLNSRVVL